MISVLDRPEDVAQSAAELVVTVARTAIASRRRFLLALSGGGTPELLYRKLATPELQRRIDWRHAEIYWSDERCVPPDDPASNYGMAAALLLQWLPVPPETVHRIEGELGPAVAAGRYDALLRERLPSPITFDLVLLGLGEDGHVASLFPGAPALAETGRLAVPVVGAAKPPADRVSLTLRAINGSRAVAVLVTGSAKASVAARVLGPEPPSSGGRPPLPAERLAPAGRDVRWFLDAAAAALLAPGLDSGHRPSGGR